MSDLIAAGWTRIADSDSGGALELWGRAWPDHAVGLPAVELNRRIAALTSVLEVGHSSELIDLNQVDLDLERLILLRDHLITD